MDITDKENFQKQMDFLKRHNFTNMFINFDGYLCLYQYLFFDLIFIDFLADNSKRHIINGNIDQ